MSLLANCIYQRRHQHRHVGVQKKKCNLTSRAAFCSDVPCTMNLKRSLSSDCQCISIYLSNNSRLGGSYIHTSIIFRYLRACLGSSLYNFFCSSVSTKEKISIRVNKLGNSQAYAQQKFFPPGPANCCANPGVIQVGERIQ